MDQNLRVRITVKVDKLDRSKTIYESWNKVAETELTASAEMFSPTTAAMALIASSSKLLASVEEAEAQATFVPSADPAGVSTADELDGAADELDQAAETHEPVAVSA